MKLKVIESEKEYDAVLERINELMDCKPNSPEEDELKLLALIVGDYEKRVHPIGPPTPLGAIRFFMEEECLTAKDLIPIIGSRSKVSEVLSGKRSLSLNMIRALHAKLGIPLEVLITETKTTKGRAKTSRTRETAAKSTSSSAKQKSYR